MILREMQPGDAMALAEIERICFSDPWSAAAFLEESLNPDARFIVACDGEAKEIIGYAGMFLAADEGHIANIAVLPAFRRRGIARRLMEKLNDIARENRLVQLQLEVRASNEGAMALYVGQGFVRVGVRKRYYRFPTEDAVLMNRDLTGMEGNENHAASGN